MIRSMTGFGIAESDTEKFICKVELKSLNGKFFELNIRMPRNWQHKELDVRNELNKSIERGSATLSINLQYKKAYPKPIAATRMPNNEMTNHFESRNLQRD